MTTNPDPVEVARFTDEQLRPHVYNAALKWCGSKDRETFPNDLTYFQCNWRSLPGLRGLVVAEAVFANAQLMKGQDDAE